MSTSTDRDQPGAPQRPCVVRGLVSGHAAGLGRWTPRYAPATFRAAWWAALSLRRARRRLKAQSHLARVPPPPPWLPFDAARGVNAILRRTKPTCLERATVLQAWLAAHGHAVDIVIGVLLSSGTLSAHAWIDSDTADAGEFAEISRVGPPMKAPV